VVQAARLLWCPRAGERALFEGPMIRFELPTDRVDYLQLAFPSAGAGLIARWGTQSVPYTVATWHGPGTPPRWQLTAKNHSLCLSPDGEWVSVFDEQAGKVRITRVGAKEPTAVVDRDSGAKNVWTAVAPGGVAVAWKDGQVTVVQALPGGEPIARVKSGWGVALQFSPGGRWLTEEGQRVVRVFDRTNNYRVFSRMPSPRDMLASVTDGVTAVVTAPDRSTVTVWDLSNQSPSATLEVGGWVTALAISADGRRVLTGNLHEVTLWDAAGARLQRYDWGVRAPIAAVFAPDGMRAAVGGTDGRIVVWDLDD
jgi:WD40 repeat protein